jgi:hypothetical protein
MVMPKNPGKYSSIAEIRSSFYPGRAGMLDLEKKAAAEAKESEPDGPHDDEP